MFVDSVKVHNQSTLEHLTTHEAKYRPSLSPTSENPEFRFA
jgi:hypothetical protein